MPPFAERRPRSAGAVGTKTIDSAMIAAMRWRSAARAQPSLALAGFRRNLAGRRVGRQPGVVHDVVVAVAEEMALTLIETTQAPRMKNAIIRSAGTTPMKM